MIKLLVVTHSPEKARTIWSILGDPDNKVATNLPIDFAGLKAKNNASWDETNSYAPIWGVTKERPYGSFMKQARKAERIVIDSSNVWWAGLLEDILRSSAVPGDIATVNIDQLEPDAVKKRVTEHVPIDRDTVDLTWRQMIADRVFGTSIAKQMRKYTDIDWQPTLLELKMLLEIDRANRADETGNRAGVPHIDVKQPTVIGALHRLSDEAHASEVAVVLTRLIDEGKLCLNSQHATGKLLKWCDENYDTIRADKINAMNMLVPADAALDLKTIAPNVRAVYTNVWAHAVKAINSEAKIQPRKEPDPYASNTINFLAADPFKLAEVMGNLRAKNLVFGRTYTTLTDTGMLAVAFIRSTWPLLGDPNVLAMLLQRLNDQTVRRSHAIESVKSCLSIMRDDSLVADTCHSCSGKLTPKLTGRHLRLFCQDASCGAIWAPVLTKQGTLSVMTDPVRAPRWCKKDGTITTHTIAFDTATRLITQTCDTCSTSMNI